MINFREPKSGYLFNKPIHNLMKKILNYIHRGTVNEMISCLYEDLLPELKDSQLELYGYSPEQIFSLRIQNFIYYICHVDINLQNTFLEELIYYSQSRGYLFLSYDVENIKIPLWIDPKTKYSALISLCDNGKNKMAVTLLAELERVAGSIHHPEYINYLIHKNNSGYSAFHYACENGNNDLLLFLFNRAEKIRKDNQNFSLEDFLSSTTNKNRNTLCSAIAHNKFITFLILIDLAKKVFHGQTDKFLHYVTCNDDDYSTILHVICLSGNLLLLRQYFLDILEVFSNSQLDINNIIHYRNIQGESPLDLCLASSNSEGISHFIDFAYKATKEQDPQKFHDLVIYIFKKLNKKSESMLLHLLPNTNASMMQRVLQIIQDFIQKNSLYNTQYIEFINWKNIDGNTVINVAAQRQQWEMVEVLLHGKADPRIMNDDYLSAVHYIESTEDRNDLQNQINENVRVLFLELDPLLLEDEEPANEINPLENDMPSKSHSNKRKHEDKENQENNKSNFFYRDIKKQRTEEENPNSCQPQNAMDSKTNKK